MVLRHLLRVNDESWYNQRVIVVTRKSHFMTTSMAVLPTHILIDCEIVLVLSNNVVIHVVIIPNFPLKGILFRLT